MHVCGMWDINIIEPVKLHDKKVIGITSSKYKKKTSMFLKTVMGIEIGTHGQSS